MRRIVLLLGVAAGVACTSLSGLTGDSDAGADAQADGGADATGAPPPDAGCEASFCACEQPAHDFCADFDDGRFPYPFASVTYRNPSVIAVALDDGGAKTPPASLRARGVAFMDQGGDVIRQASVNAVVGLRATTTIAFDVQIAQLGSTQTTLCTVAYGSPTREVLYFVAPAGALGIYENTVLDDGGYQVSSHTARAAAGLVTGNPVFAHMVITLRVPDSGVGGAIDVAVDGVDVFRNETLHAPVPNAPTLSVSVGAADDCTFPCTDVDVRFDDVTVDSR